MQTASTFQKTNIEAASISKRVSMKILFPAGGSCSLDDRDRAAPLPNFPFTAGKEDSEVSALKRELAEARSYYVVLFKLILMLMIGHNLL